MSKHLLMDFLNNIYVKVSLLLGVLFTVVISIYFFWFNITTINNNEYAIDSNSKNIIILKDSVNIKNPRKLIIIGERNYKVRTKDNYLKPGKKYDAIDKDEKDYNIFASTVPILEFFVDEKITSNSYIETALSIKTKDAKMLRHHGRIRKRGAYTLRYPKKSLRLELTRPDDENETYNASLLGMRSDDDWILQAMYNEPLRLRDKVAHELWNQIHHFSRNKKYKDYKNHIRSKYVEIFINNDYKGVYNLSERIDQKQLQLDKKDGLLFKAKEWGTIKKGRPTKFETIPKLPIKDTNYWSGYKQKHPKELKWEEINKIMKFIVNSNDEYFYKDISQVISIENTIDYFIFINMLAAYDNTGKNLFLAKTNMEAPFYFVPWDLDATFGNNYKGERFKKYDERIISNELFNRFIKDNSPYKKLIKNRWLELKKNKIVNANHIMSIFKKHHLFLKNQGVYLREREKWKDFNLPENSLDNIDYWLKTRISFLDDYFNSF